MSIHEQLSLATNGGVYFEGARMNPSKDAFLFVGLGGTGADSLLRIKNEIKRRMRLPKDEKGRIVADVPPNMAFLAADTDNSIKNKGYGSARFDEFGAEFIDLTVDDVERVLADIRRNRINSPVWSWMDPRLTPAIGLTGSGGIRQIGRMKMIRNFETLRHDVNLALAKIADTHPGSTYIVLLSGIAGGTGAGMFLDMAFLLRHFAVQEAGLHNVQVLGYLVLPDVNIKNGGDEAMLKRNGFACLKELDYWMSMSEHGNAFEQHYSNTFCLHANVPPFDFCHLISAQNFRGHPISYDEALCTLAENVFAYTSDETVVNAAGNTAVFSMYNNLSEYMSAMIPRYPARNKYLSIGAAKTEIPYTEITTLIAARVFEQLRPIFGIRPTRETFMEESRRMGITDELLRGAVQKGIEPSPLITQKFKYEDVWGVVNRVASLFETYHSSAQQRMRINSSNLPQVYEKAVRRELEALMRSKRRGPCYAAKLINSTTDYCLVKTLEGLRKLYDDLAMQENEKTQRLMNEAQNLFIMGQHAKLGRKKDCLKSYLDVMRNYDQSSFLWYLYYDLARAVEKLVDRLNKYYSRIFKPLDDVLQLLPDIFLNNLEYIRATEADNPNWLIKPLDFERQKAAQLRAKVAEATEAFFESLYANMSLWIGCEMDDVNEQISGIQRADVPGFISKFIEDNFNNLLSINLEELISANMRPGETFDAAVRGRLEALKENAIPMFMPSPVHADDGIKDFAFISVPNECPGVLTNINERDPAIQLKRSGEKSKISMIKVIYGISLYTIARAEELERAYEDAARSSNFIGVHLYKEMQTELSSPVPQATWSDGYSCNSTLARNERFRKSFDKCVAAGIIRLQDEGRARLYISGQEFDASAVMLYGKLHERLDQLIAHKARLYRGNFIELNSCGTYLTLSDGPLANIRENTLRFYNVCAAIERESAILDRIEVLSKRLVDTEHYAKALIMRMILTSHPNRIFKKSEMDPQPRTLINLSSNLTALKNYYLEFNAFGKGLTEEEIINIKARWDALIARLKDSSEKREQLLERLGAVKAEMHGCEEEIRHKMQLVNASEAPALQAECQFYMDIQDICDAQALYAEHLDSGSESRNSML